VSSLTRGTCRGAQRDWPEVTEENTNVIGLMSRHSVEVCQASRVNTDTAVWWAFLHREDVRRVLRRPEVKALVVDNAGYHHTFDKQIDKYLLELGVETLYLAPYSPQDNPIEEVWSQMKAYLRTNWYTVGGDIGMMHMYMSMAAAAVTPEQCVGYYRHCASVLCR